MFDFYYQIYIQYVNGGSDQFKLSKVNLETDDTDSLIKWGSGMLSAGVSNPHLKSAYILMYCKAGMLQITKQYDDEEAELSITPEPTEGLWATAKIDYMISKVKSVYIYTMKSNEVVYNKVRLNDELLHTDIKLKPIILQFPDIII